MNAYDHAVSIVRIANTLEDAAIARDTLSMHANILALQARIDSLLAVLPPIPVASAS